MINPHSRCSLSARHGNDPPVTTAVVEATVGGYSSCLLRTTADEGGRGDDTYLTWAGCAPAFCRPPMLPSIPTFFCLFLFLQLILTWLKRWLIFISLPLTSIYITPAFIPLIWSLSSSNLSLFHTISSLSWPLFPSSNLFPVLPRPICASQQAQSGACTPHEQRLWECIEILIDPACKTAFRAIRGGSTAAPKQRVWTLGTATVMQWQMVARWSKANKKKRKRERAHAYTWGRNSSRQLASSHASAKFPPGDSIYWSEHVNPVLMWTLIHLS